MISKTVKIILSALTAAAVTAGCASDSEEAASASTPAAVFSGNNSKSDEVELGDNTCAVEIGSEISVIGDGASYQSGVLSITKGGVYSLSGTIADGCVYIDAEDNVKLILNGFSVSNGSGAAIYCYNAKNLYIELAEGTENVLTDGSAYTFGGQNESSAENEPNAALYSKSDLVICGNGKLSVTGNYALGIRCNDDLTIESGNITVNAVTNGIRGSDSLVIEGGSLNVTAGDDGLKSTNDTESDKGYILISGGSVEINAGEDGIQAEHALSVTGGEIKITTTGDVAAGGNDGGWGGRPWGRSASADDSNDASSKGLKSGGAMVIDGGKIEVDSTDHCVHSAGTLDIKNGELYLTSSKGKGISSHGNLVIDNGIINVANSTEGIESKSDMTVNGGEITIAASDDGLNCGGGSDMFNFSFNENQDNNEGDSHNMYLNGGYIYINAAGDDIDSNGNIEVSGGTVIVNGPTNGGNGALDCGDMNCSITVNGGMLIAVGSSQMAEAPGNGSSQNSLSINASMNGGDTFAVQSSDGKNIAVFTVAKNVQHIVISSADIKMGETYSIYTNVSASGDSKGGLYSDSAEVTVSGEPAVTVTVNSVTTGSNGGAGGFGGGGFGGGHGGFGGGHGDFGRGNEDLDEGNGDFDGSNGNFGGNNEGFGGGIGVFGGDIGGFGAGNGNFGENNGNFDGNMPEAAIA